LKDFRKDYPMPVILGEAWKFVQGSIDYGKNYPRTEFQRRERILVLSSKVVLYVPPAQE
jgi:hypothetical protein